MKSTTWQTIRDEIHQQAAAEPILASYLHATILNHNSSTSALSYLLASKLDSPTASALMIREVIEEAFAADPSICAAVSADLHATFERDSACRQLSVPFLYYKGFHALQAFRVAHWLWSQGRTAFALFLQNRISVALSLDIHPAARIGKGIFLDHGTGIVIGETAVVEDDVSIMQSVTLGGTGKVSGDRHPKIGPGVLIGPGAKVLGNIRIGEGVQIGASSVVLKPVPPHRVVAGVPAIDLGEANADHPAEAMCQQLLCKQAKSEAS